MGLLITNSTIDTHLQFEIIFFFEIREFEWPFFYYIKENVINFSNIVKFSFLIFKSKNI